MTFRFTYRWPLIILALAGCATEQPPEQMAPLVIESGFGPFEPVCMRDSEFAIGGVQLGASEAQLRAKLGPPLSVIDSPNLYDLWIEERFVYDGLTVDLFQDQVSGLRALTPEWQTPSGLVVGMTETALIAKFGREVASTVEPDGLKTYRVYYCNNGDLFDLGSLFQVSVDDTGIVRAIGIATETP